MVDAKELQMFPEKVLKDLGKISILVGSHNFRSKKLDKMPKKPEEAFAPMNKKIFTIKFSMIRIEHFESAKAKKF